MVNEGTPVTLTGSFLDPDDADTHTYDWHVVASSGQQIADGYRTQFHVHPRQRRHLHGDVHGHGPQWRLGIGPGRHHVKRRARRSSRPPPPTQSVFAGESTTITLGSLAATGVGPFTDTVQWGDGQTSTFDPSGSGPLSLTHTYATGGMHTISETVCGV